MDGVVQELASSPTASKANYSNIPSPKQSQTHGNNSNNNNIEHYVTTLCYGLRYLTGFVLVNYHFLSACATTKRDRWHEAPRLEVLMDTNCT